MIGVAAMADAPYVANVVVLKDGPIETIGDLKGRLISVSTRGSLSEWLMRELAIRQGWGKDGIPDRRPGRYGRTGCGDENSPDRRHERRGRHGVWLEDEGVGRIVVNFGTLMKDSIST